MKRKWLGLFMALFLAACAEIPLALTPTSEMPPTPSAEPTATRVPTATPFPPVPTVASAPIADLPLASSTFPLRPLWARTTEHLILLPPRVVSNVVVLKQDAGLILTEDHDIEGTYLGLDAQSGIPLWTIEGYVSPRERNAWAAIDNYLLLLGNTRVEALDISPGKQVWTTPPAHPSVLQPSRVQHNTDTFFVMNGDTEVIAFEARSGQEQWRTHLQYGSFNLFYDASHEVLVIPSGGNGSITSQPPATMYLVFIDAHNGQIAKSMALDEELSKQCDNDLLQYTTPYLYCNDVAFNHETGQKIYFDTGSAVALSVPPVWDGQLLIRTHAGTMQAIDSPTGQVRWDYQPLPHTLTPTVEIISHATIIGNMGYVLANDASIRAIDLNTGTEFGYWLHPQGASLTEMVYKWQPTGPMAGLATDGVRLFATFGNNEIYAFEP